MYEKGAVLCSLNHVALTHCSCRKPALWSVLCCCVVSDVVFVSDVVLCLMLCCACGACCYCIIPATAPNSTATSNQPAPIAENRLGRQRWTTTPCRQLEHSSRVRTSNIQHPKSAYSFHLHACFHDLCCFSLVPPYLLGNFLLVTNFLWGVEYKSSPTAVQEWLRDAEVFVSAKLAS